MTSLLATLLIAAAVGHAISRSVRRLGQHALPIVNGERNLKPLSLSGPRELSVSAHALNECVRTPFLEL